MRSEELIHLKMHGLISFKIFNIEVVQNYHFDGLGKMRRNHS